MTTNLAVDSANNEDNLCAIQRVLVDQTFDEGVKV